MLLQALAFYDVKDPPVLRVFDDIMPIYDVPEDCPSPLAILSSSGHWMTQQIVL